MSASVGLWVVFGIAVVVMLAIDLGVRRREAERPTLGKALGWSVVWIAVALTFAAVLWGWRGGGMALTFVTAYLVEKSLSIDNIFIFSLIFSYFRVPMEHRHRVLFWGVVGALLMRAGLIAAGIALVESFHWVQYVFGAFLVATGARIAWVKERGLAPEESALPRLARSLVRVTDRYHGVRFFIRRDGALVATPLALALVMVETTDLVFALDSIPSVLAITSDPLLVYTSNVFALLGLRALYFAVAGLVERFRYFYYALAAILVLAGLKMLLSRLVDIPVGVTLGVLGTIIAVAGIASFVGYRRDRQPRHGERAITRTIVLVLLVVLQPASGFAAAEEVAVAVGDVTAGTALLRVRGAGPGPVSVVVEPDSPGDPVMASVQPDNDLVARLSLRDLAPGRRYRYRIESGGRTVNGEFVTAPAPGEATPVSLVWSGDLGARKHCSAGPYGAFDAMAALHPDLFLFVGDTIYADHSCPALAGGDGAAATFDAFRARYRHNLSDSAVQRLLRRTSVTAIWDDHEVRSNFAGPTEPLMPIGRAAFLASWPVATPPGEPTRLYRSLRWGAVLEIFVLDTRQYRSPNHRPDGPDKTMLGAAQRQWLIDSVAASPAVWKVVVSSVPLSLPKGWFIGDSWAPRSLFGYRTGFAHERDAILAALHAAGVQNLVVVAADVHFAAAIAHAPARGFHLWELVAGPLAANTKDPWAPAPGLGSRVLFAHGGEPTFGELQVGARELGVRLFAGDGRLLWMDRLPAAGRQAARPSPRGR